MNSPIEIHEFFVEGNNQDRSHVLLHITEPGTPEEEKKGYFFAVAEINNGNLEQIEHLQQMIDDLESGYYETEDQENKTAFEITLEYINRRGHHVLQYENAITNCLVGVLRENELSFAYHGNPEATLFYQGKEDLEQMSAIEQNPGELNNESLFSSVMQGNISEGDYFYIASPHVNDYFTADRVKKIILTRNTRQSAEHLQKVLGDLNNELSFGGIIFHIPTKDQIPKTGKQPKTLSTGSEESLNNMLSQEQNTKELLSPSLLNKVGKGVSNYLSEKKEKNQQKNLEKIQQERKEKIEIINQTDTIINKKGHIETNYRSHEAEPNNESLFNTILVIVGRSLVQGVIGIFRLIKKIGLTIGKLILMLFLLTTNLHNKRQDVIYEYRRKIEERKIQLDELPLISKIIFLLVIILAFVFLGSIMLFKINENKKADNLAYQNKLQSINDKKTAAEASLLYGDENQALNLLQEANQEISTLPQKNKEQTSQVNELINGINANLLKLRKIYTVNPQLIVDLKINNPEVNTQKLATIDGTILAYGPEDKNFYKINLTAKEATKIDHGIFPRLTTADTPKENDKIIFLSGTNSLAAYQKDSSTLSKLDITYLDNQVNLSAIAIYSQKLYAVDIANNKILKHNSTQTGFDKGQSWLKTPGLDIKDAVSLAIDGDLYLLKKTGEIYKFTAGEKQEFAISGLDPALSGPTQIWTYNGVNNIYILENTNKRIVVLDKTGKLIAQYTANDWQNPTSMIVKESEKTIYVLDSNKVYKIGI